MFYTGIACLYNTFLPAKQVVYRRHQNCSLGSDFAVYRASLLPQVWTDIVKHTHKLRRKNTLE